MRRSLGVLLFGLAAVATCHAGTITYDFAGTTLPSQPVRNEDFRYTSSSFIQSQLLVNLAQLDSCVNCYSGPGFTLVFSDNCDSNPGCNVSIQFNDGNDSGYVYFFASGAFSSPGIHNTIDPPEGSASQWNSATLTVQGDPADPAAPAAAGVPEPSTMLMMFGLLPAFVFFARRHPGRRR
jgi:hypothetical protein